MKIIKCPCCNGEGGETDYVVEYLPGIWDGPYYPCEFCKEEAKVSILKWFAWHWNCRKMTHKFSRIFDKKLKEIDNGKYR